LLAHNISHSVSETYKMIQLSKDESTSDVFNDIKSIDESILGSGSLAQTHICYLKSDPTKKYVIKVAHPIIFQITTEIQIIKSLLNFVSYFTKINVDWTFFFNSIMDQSDLRNEAKNMAFFKNIYLNYDKVEIPDVIYANKYFIIMTFCEGIEMYKLQKTDPLYISATNILASSIVYSYYKYGTFHGDLHQGNILVKPNGYICLLDFGIVLQLKKLENREALYIYQKCVYDLKYKNVLRLLEILLVNDKRVIIPDFIKKCKDFINLYKSSSTIHVYRPNVNLLNCIKKFCTQYDLKLDSDLLNGLLQFIILESFDLNSHATNILLRTFFYMKKDEYLMKEMGEYILKYYKFECKYAFNYSSIAHIYAPQYIE